jgi:hypothetical protein
MAKANVLLVDNNYNYDTNKIELLLGIVVVPIAPETFTGGRLNVPLIVNGTETAQQLTMAVENKVKEAALQNYGVTLSSSDITSTKFT